MADGSAGLIFKISADSKQAEAEIKRFANNLAQQAKDAGTGFVSGFGPVGAAIAGIAGPAAIAVAAIGAIGLAAVGVAEKLFSMAEAAATLGGQFASFQAKTGLSADAISALAYAAKLSGKELTDLQRPLVAFVSNIGKASEGNEKASATLKKLGVTDFNNLDKALDQATIGLNKMAPGINKIETAAGAFGKRGGLEMITLLKKMPEGLSAMEVEAKKLGVTLSQDDIKAAKEFNHAMETVEYQVKIAAARFALQYAPQITAAIESISKWLASNQDTARAWGSAVSDYIRGVSVFLGNLNSAATSALDSVGIHFRQNASESASWADRTIANISRVIIAWTTLGLSEMGALGAANRPPEQYGPFASDMSPAAPVKIPNLGGGGGGKGGGGKGGGRGRGGGKGGKADNSAAKEELQNQIELQQIALQRLEKAYSETMDKIQEEFDKTDDQGLFSKQSQDAIDAYRDKILVVRAKILDLADSLGTLDKESDSKLRVRLAKQFDDAIKLSDRLVKDHDKNSKLIEQSDVENAKKVLDIRKQLHDDLKQLDDDQREFAIEGAHLEADVIIEASQRTLDDENSTKKQREQAYIDLMQARGKLANFLIQDLRSRHANEMDAYDIEEQARKKEINDTVRDEVEKTTKLEAIEKLYHDRRILSESVYQQKLKEIESGAVVTATVKKSADAMKAAFDSLKDIGKGALDGLANGIGNIVSQFVLMGTAGPNAMRKLVASVLAGVAAQAAVLAIMEVAKGFAALASYDPVSATGHFHAAALFGIVAGASAIAGRAIAGNAFKDQAGAATGSNTPQQTPQNNYGTPFGGFGGGGANGPNGLTGTLNKLNMTQAALEETVNKLATRIEGMSPGDVVSMGAGDASSDIRHAYESELSNSGGRATANLARATGSYR